jgi:hypothetical protein
VQPGSPFRASDVPCEDWARQEVPFGGLKSPNPCREVNLVVIHISLFIIA